MRVKRELVEKFATQEANRRVYHAVERYKLRLSAGLLNMREPQEFLNEQARIDELIKERYVLEEKKYFEID